MARDGRCRTPPGTTVRRRGRRPPPAEPAATACRRWRSPASARCPTSRRRTTGSGATSPSTSGSPRGSAGLRVADLACGEGYGSDVLARDRAPRWSASTPTPRPTSTRGCATGAPNLRFERDLVETFAGPCDAIVFLQTIEHIDDPGALLDGFARAAPVALRLDAEPAHARPARAPRSPTTPGTCASTRPPSTGRCCEPRFDSRRAPRRLSRPQAARCTSSRSEPAGTASTRAADHEALLRPLRARRSPPPTSRSGRPRSATSTAPLDFLAVCRR